MQRKPGVPVPSSSPADPAPGFVAAAKPSPFPPPPYGPLRPPPSSSLLLPRAFLPAPSSPGSLPPPRSLLSRIPPPSAAAPSQGSAVGSVLWHFLQPGRAAS